jgi:hypothetical protein
VGQWGSGESNGSTLELVELRGLIPMPPGVLLT